MHKIYVWLAIFGIRIHSASHEYLVRSRSFAEARSEHLPHPLAALVGQSKEPNGIYAWSIRFDACIESDYQAAMGESLPSMRVSACYLCGDSIGPAEGQSKDHRVPRILLAGAPRSGRDFRAPDRRRLILPAIITFVARISLELRCSCS